ncbi:MAG: NfeD family protein [Burkholderiales bacterium]|nr:NfeD family protein [Opitutaceae bacterium]
MDNTVITLFAVGLVLLSFEIVVPGAILGIAGGLSLLAGVIVAFMTHGQMGGALALLVAVAAVTLLLYLEFRILPRTRIGRRMFLEKAIDGTSQPPVADAADAVVGREALALTTLAPTGVVEVAGKRYEARCDSGFAAEGARLRVTRVESFQLVVIASD